MLFHAEQQITLTVVCSPNCCFISSIFYLYSVINLVYVDITRVYLLFTIKKKRQNHNAFYDDNYP